MSEPTHCPNPEQLGGLLAGRLPEEEQATLAEHLDTCEDCRKTLEGMAGGDKLVPGRAGPPGVHQADQETALQDVMAQLKADVLKEPSQADDAVEDTLSLDFLEPSDNPDHLGRFGPYEITEVVGRGGMGVVLKGFDPRLHRFVAVKVLAPQLASHVTARRRFQREAQAAAAVSHDHVITIHAVEEAAELPYLVMEYVSGLSLRERIDRDGPLEVEEILRIGVQAASGLAAAHAHGVIHRDIKPANILLENGVERVKITDFGLARAVDDVTMTQTGVVAGTPQYMSPEQARGDPVDHRSDLFSLGSVLYAMCTGRPPFRAETTMGVIRRVCEEQPRLVREINQEIPDWLVEIIHKLMAKDPNERFQSAAEVADLLGQHLAHLQQPSVVPRPPRLPRRPSEFAGRSITQPRLGLWLAALVLLMVCGFGLTEVTGVTNVTELVATVLRIRTPHGTLVVEVEDPEVSVDVEGDGETITLSGLGPHEIRLRPGTHQLRKTKDGVPVGTEWVTVTRGGKQVVKIGFDAASGQPEGIGPTGPSLGKITREVRRFEGSHVELITCVAVSADGHRLLSGSEDATLRLWDIKTGEEIRPLLGHTRAVRCVGLSPDGRYALSGGEDNTVRLWDLDTGKQLRSFEGHEARVVAVAFSPDGRVALSGSADYGPKGDVILRLWDVETGRQLRSLPAQNHIIEGAAFSPDGRRVLAACAGVPGPKRIGLWDTETGQLVRYFLGRSAVTSVAFSPDGRRVISGHSGFVFKDGVWLLDPQCCLLRLWDVETGREIRPFKGHSGPVNSVAFSPDGRYVLSGSGGRHGGDGEFVQTDDNTVRLWDAETGREVCCFNAGQRVTSVAFTPDGRFIVSGGGAGPPDLRLWEVPESPVTTAAPETSAEGALSVPESLNEIRRFEGHTRWITGLAFFDDGRKAISASNDTTLRIWDVHTGEELRRINTGAPVSSLALSPDEKLAAAGVWTSSGFHLWSLESGEMVRTFEGLVGARVGYLAFSSDGRRIVSSSYHKVARLWDLETGEEIRRFQTTGNPMGATYSPDGRFIVTQDPDKNILVSEAESGEPVHVLPTHDTGETLRTAFSPDGRQLVTGSQIGVLRLWDVSTGKEIRQVSGHERPVVAVIFTPDGRHVISGSIERSLRVCETASGREVARIRSDTRRFDHLAVSPDGRHVITGGGAAWLAHRGTWEPDGDFAVHLYRLPEPAGRAPAPETSAEGAQSVEQSANEVRRFQGTLHALVGCLDVSRDGRRLLSGSNDRTVRLWDVETTEEIRLFHGHTRALFCVAFSPDGRHALSGSRDGSMRLWDVETGAEIHRFEGHEDWVWDVAFSPDGRFAVSGTASYEQGNRGSVRVWDVETGRQIRQFDGIDRSIKGLAFSPDGRQVLVGGDWGLVGLWDVETGRQIRRFLGAGTNVCDVAFSPDGRRVVSGQVAMTRKDGAWLDPENSVACLWDAETGREIRRFKGHTGGILSVAFSPDGRHVLTGSGGHDDSTGYYKAYDNTIRLWDVETGAELCRFNPGQRVTSVAFLPDGRFIVSGGGDVQPDLRLWELPQDLVSSGAEQPAEPDSEPEPSPPPQGPPQTSEPSGAGSPETERESQ